MCMSSDANDVVARRSVVKGPLTPEGCAIRERPHRQRSRGGKWNPERASRGEGHSASKAVAPAPRAEILTRARRHHVRQVLHRAPGAGERHRVCDHAARRSSRLSSPGLGVSADHAADGAGDDDLSRREREDAGGNSRAADRATGQRRREDALHAVELHRRRPLHADGYLPGRHRPRLRAGARAEPRRRRRSRSCRSPVQQQGVVTKKKETSPLQIITLSSKDNRYDALFLSNFATLQLARQARAACPAWATWSSSASANTACGSGSIRIR